MKRKIYGVVSQGTVNYNCHSLLAEARDDVKCELRWCDVRHKWCLSPEVYIIHCHLLSIVKTHYDPGR